MGIRNAFLQHRSSDAEIIMSIRAITKYFMDVISGPEIQVQREGQWNIMYADAFMGFGGARFVSLWRLSDYSGYRLHFVLAILCA